VPVDIVPLYCSDISGISYVETSSLDGEKNLKPKIALSETQLMFNKKK
jgi:phospholipid-transporting ATPase